MATHCHSIAIPTRPAAIATPTATTIICPDVAGDAGAAPFATADAVADPREEVADPAFELKEADTEDGNGLASLTSLVYISISWLPTLLQNS